MTAAKSLTRGRALKMPEPDLVAAIQAWQEAYETDPRVTQYTIAEAIGVAQPTVSKRVRELGWAVPDAVARARKGGHFEGFPLARYPTGHKRLEIAPRPQCVEDRAPASIFQLALGKLVTTVRYGGRHVEVMA